MCSHLYGSLFILQTMSNTLDNLLADESTYVEMIEEKQVCHSMHLSPFILYSYYGGHSSVKVVGLSNFPEKDYKTMV